jgi:hypothetical protein
MCESFNKWIIEARFFPIINMLEKIRRKVMVRIHDNMLKSDRWLTKICPNILKKMNTYITHSGKCHAICNGAAQFEVMHFDNRFTVDLYNKVCSCRYWQLSGLPCPHAISCIFFKTNCLDDYIAPCYSTESFKKTYAHCRQPVEGMTSWPVSDREKLKAPGYVRMPGRPKTERRREATEPPKGSRMSKVGTVIRCTKCKQTGHNRTSRDKRNAASAGNPTAGSQATSTQVVGSQASGSQAAGTPHEMVVVSNTQSSCTTSKKRNQSIHTKTAAKVTIQLTILH